MTAPIPDATLSAMEHLAPHGECDADEILALIASYREIKATLLDYESRITWDTTCKTCASLLGRAYADHARAEKAEADLAALRAGIEVLLNYSENPTGRGWTTNVPVPKGRIRHLLEKVPGA